MYLRSQYYSNNNVYIFKHVVYDVVCTVAILTKVLVTVTVRISISCNNIYCTCNAYLYYNTFRYSLRKLKKSFQCTQFLWAICLVVPSIEQQSDLQKDKLTIQSTTATLHEQNFPQI